MTQHRRPALRLAYSARRPPPRPRPARRLPRASGASAGADAAPRGQRARRAGGRQRERERGGERERGRGGTGGERERGRAGRGVIWQGMDHGRSVVLAFADPLPVPLLRSPAPRVGGETGRACERRFDERLWCGVCCEGLGPALLPCHPQGIAASWDKSWPVVGVAVRTVPRTWDFACDGVSDKHNGGIK